MIRSLSVLVIASMTSGLLYSSEGDSPLAIVEKAIKAHGGEANLAKYPAMKSKGTGTFYGLGEGIPFTGEWAIQGASHQNLMIEAKFNNMALKFQRVVNGDKGWIKLDELTSEMGKEELAEEKEKLLARQVASLYPLKDKSFQLALLGEAKVGEKPAVGIRVSKKGHRDIKLYFDKESGMLVKYEHMTKDYQAGSDEYLESTIFQEYKTAKGILVATKILIQKNGNRLVEAQMTSFEPLEKLDNSLFQRP